MPADRLIPLLFPHIQDLPNQLQFDNPRFAVSAECPGLLPHLLDRRPPRASAPDLGGGLVGVGHTDEALPPAPARPTPEQLASRWYMFALRLLMGMAGG